MEYKKYIFDETIEKIKNVMSFYENSKQRGNVYQLYLANGDVIRYSINKNNIAHLLGVDLNKLVSHKILEKDESYNMLLQLVNNPYKYWNSVKGTINPEELFSQYVCDKIDNFNLQLQVPYPNQMYFVCKYSRERNYMAKEIDGLYADYYIARKNEQGDVVLLGLVKANDLDNNIMYIPQTSRIIKNDDDFDTNMANILKNQIITYVKGTSINNYVTGYDRNINLNTIEIMEKLQGINSLCNMTDGIACTIQDHIYNLRGFRKTRDASYDTKVLLMDINSKIKSRELINITPEEKEILDASILSIIDSYNDNLFSNDKVSSDNIDAYSDLKKERDSLISEKEELIEELRKEKELVMSLKNSIQVKDEEIEELNNTKNDYDEIKQNILSLANSLH